MFDLVFFEQAGDYAEANRDAELDKRLRAKSLNFTEKNNMTFWYRLIGDYPRYNWRECTAAEFRQYQLDPYVDTKVEK